MLKKIIDEIFEYRPYRIGNMNYEEYWLYRKDSGKKGLKHRDLIIGDLIEDNSSVLDIGCGNGRLLNYLINEKGVEGHGYDYSETALNTKLLEEETEGYVPLCISYKKKVEF